MTVRETLWADLRAALPVDIVLLGLHGAMVADGCDDCEGELLSLDWLDRERFPVAVRVRETGERIELPLQDIVSFGRMDIIEGMSANDIVLTLPDGMATRQISRWHFELRRRTDGYILRSVTSLSLIHI